jgi:signal peptide peptidase SppA
MTSDDTHQGSLPWQQPGTAWALEPASLPSNAIAFVRSIGPSSGPPPAGPGEGVPGGVAGYAIHGTVWPRRSLNMALFGGTSLSDLRAYLKQVVADRRVRSILLEIDSPGGSVYGVHETWQAIRAADAVKPVTAAIGGLAASAGYWLASACRRISLTPSGDAGGIGVYGIHQDRMKYWARQGVVHTVVSAGTHKAESLDLVPMTDGSKARLQRRVNQIYAQFVADVAAGRHATHEAVRSGFGQGAILAASDALAARLVDAIEPVDVTRNRLASPAGLRMAQQASAEDRLRAAELRRLAHPH